MEKSVLRIIDANFNRGREAARVMEEFCRFCLNSKILSGQVKQLRHELCGEIAKFDSLRLLAARDTVGDVGVGQRVEKQLKRGDLKDSFTAACKRFSEAMRVLAETSQFIDTDSYAVFEDLRYRCYTIEREVGVLSDSVERFRKIKLYVLITSESPLDIISMARCCAIGGADCIQIRSKDMNDNQLAAVSEQVAEFCRDMGIFCIVNDRLDIAMAAGADGVHLGQDDLQTDFAKKVCPGQFIIGKSTHDMKQLEKALSDTPTYVGIGPVFATPTKDIPDIAGLDYVSSAFNRLKDEASLGVAIGGINLDNIEQVLEAGAQAVAVCSAVTKAADPIEACKKLKSKVENFAGK